MASSAQRIAATVCGLLALGLTGSVVAPASASVVTRAQGLVVPSCPTKLRVPTTTGTKAPTPTAVPIPANPSSAVVCAFGQMAGESSGGNLLGRRAAAALATVVDAEPPASAGAVRCVLAEARHEDAYTSNVLVEFDYPASGAPARVSLLVPDLSVDYIPCSEVVGFVGGSTRQLDEGLAQFVSDWSVELEPPLLASTPTPDVFGVPLSLAERIVAPNGGSLSVSGEEVDSSVPSETAVLQDPPAGWPDPTGGVAVLLDEHPAPVCAPSQLVADFLGGEGGTQQLFGGLVVRDISAQPCELVGPLELVGVDGEGKVVTTASHPQLSPSRLVLTARGALAPSEHNLPPGVMEASLTVVGPECELLDPTGEEHLHWVDPTRWDFEFPFGTISTPNALPTGHSSPSPALSSGFTSCKGLISSGALAA